MWQDGLVEEVTGLAAAGLREGRTASRALGYAQVLQLLDGVLGRGRGADRHRHRHPAVRPAPALLVPPGRPDHLAAG